MNAVIYVNVYANTGVNVSQCIVPTVTQSHTGLHGTHTGLHVHGRPIE